MAQPLTCDICQQELGVQMLTNLTTGEVLVMGPACLPTFYAHSVLQVHGLEGHSGPPTKCRACRALHEHATTGVTPIGDVSRETSAELPDQAGTGQPSTADVSRETSDGETGQAGTEQTAAG